MIVNNDLNYDNIDIDNILFCASSVLLIFKWVGGGWGGGGGGMAALQCIEHEWPMSTHTPPSNPPVKKKKKS